MIGFTFVANDFAIVLQDALSLAGVFLLQDKTRNKEIKKNKYDFFIKQDYEYKPV